MEWGRYRVGDIERIHFEFSTAFSDSEWVN
jgi:hypothetical protein